MPLLCQGWLRYVFLVIQNVATFSFTILYIVHHDNLSILMPVFKIDQFIVVTSPTLSLNWLWWWFHVNILSVMGFKYSLTTVKLVEEMSLVDLLLSYHAGSYIHVALFSFAMYKKCIVHLSSFNSFWLSLWYLQTSTKGEFLAHLANGYMRFCHHLVSVDCLLFCILIFVVKLLNQILMIINWTKLWQG